MLIGTQSSHGTGQRIVKRKTFRPLSACSEESGKAVATCSKRTPGAPVCARTYVVGYRLFEPRASYAVVIERDGGPRDWELQGESGYMDSCSSLRLWGGQALSSYPRVPSRRDGRRPQHL